MTDDKVQTLIRYVMLALNQIYIIEYKGILRPSDSANRSFVDTKIGVFQETLGGPLTISHFRLPQLLTTV